jgi:glutamate racemase
MMCSVSIAVTDSGLGGLAVCAGLEKMARVAGRGAETSLIYVNAWPEEGRGYNDLPDMAARAGVFDRALDAIAGLAPERLLIACNTLSILYPLTSFSRRAPFPVQGIVDAGVSLFLEALRAEPDALIVLLGTRTTIESGAHRNALVAGGVDPARVAGVSCHGLATAIERDVHGRHVDDLIATCARDVAAAAPAGPRVFVGLCCTHYGYVAGRIGAAISGALGRRANALDPNARMVQDAAVSWRGSVPLGGQRPARVEVMSKVVLDANAREGVAGLVRPVSVAAAEALRHYRHTPTLF